MSEYLVKGNFSSSGVYKIGVAGKVKGVYSTSPVTLGWDYNGELGMLTPTATQVWEPNLAFEPAKTSKLVITTTAAAVVTIRME